MMDFTPKKYRRLLIALKEQKFNLLPYQDFINTKEKKSIALRHDVDRLPQHSLRIAKLEAELGIKGTYYFRIVPESFNVKIIKEIAELGHEIGYHYEDVDLTIKNEKLEIKNSFDKDKLIDSAYESFCKNLEKMREVGDIKTICMHGSPRSKFDNKIIWEKYNYKDLGILGEPYLNIDWNEVGYLTDTGRCWNGYKVSVRDKVKSKYNFNFKTTQEIIDNVDKLPDKVIFTIHPERWTDEIIPWTKNLITQYFKNVVKRGLLFLRK